MTEDEKSKYSQWFDDDISPDFDGLYQIKATLSNGGWAIVEGIFEKPDFWGVYTYVISSSDPDSAILCPMIKGFEWRGLRENPKK